MSLAKEIIIKSDADLDKHLAEHREAYNNRYDGSVKSPSVILPVKIRRVF